MIEIRKSGNIWKSKFALFIGVDESNLHFIFPPKNPGRRWAFNWISKKNLRTRESLFAVLHDDSTPTFTSSSFLENGTFCFSHTQNSTEKNSGKWSFFIKCFFSFFLFRLSACCLFLIHAYRLNALRTRQQFTFIPHWKRLPNGFYFQLQKAHNSEWGRKTTGGGGGRERKR